MRHKISTQKCPLIIISQFSILWNLSNSAVFDFPPTVEGSLGFDQTIKTSKVDRWFGLIGNQDCNQTEGTSFIAVKLHFRCNPDCFDYERNAIILTIKQSNNSNMAK